MASSEPHQRANILGARPSVKAHLLASRELLVSALYNLAPLLDSALAAGLLSQENYYEIKAEKTPMHSARKLLEIVDGQMEEGGAARFLECLRRCKQHYPRLHNWLCPDKDIQRGPTERQLQGQFSVLCARLGYSVLPVSLALFSDAVLTQYEFDQVQAQQTQYQQAQILLSICLSKGESTCCSFYRALQAEDQQLADEINVSTLEEILPALSVDCESQVSGVHVGVEETRVSIDESCADAALLLLQVMERLGVAEGDETRFNACELGVALGLPKRMVRECVLDGVGIGDQAQLGAVVTLFLEKTQDAERLRNRIKEINVKRVQLSERGCLLLKLLQEAETVLQCGDQVHAVTHLHPGDHMRNGDRDTVWSIFRFLMWDCMAEALEEPQAELGGDDDVIGIVRQLRAGAGADAALLAELEQCWEEGGAESLQQSVCVLAQFLRDLHPLEDHLRLSEPVKRLYTCLPVRAHRLTSFPGLSTRVIRRALSKGALMPLHPDATSLTAQYRELLLCLAQVLDKVQPEEGRIAHLSQASSAALARHIRTTLSRPAFAAQNFDAGVRHRLLAVLEFSPPRLGLSSLSRLHWEMLSSRLETYLRPGEHHCVRFDLDYVQMLGDARLLRAGSVRGPVAIDDGFEDVFGFVTCEPTSFLVRLRCCVSEGGGGHCEVKEPNCACVSEVGEDGASEARQTGGVVLAEASGRLWIRRGDRGWRDRLEEVARKHSARLHDQGCCFKVTTQGSECEVKFVCKRGRISAAPQRNCQVL